MAAASATVRFDPLRFTKRVVSADEQRRLTAEAAYFRAEKRLFAPGFEIQDWLHAEARASRIPGHFNYSVGAGGRVVTLAL